MRKLTFLCISLIVVLIAQGCSTTGPQTKEDKARAAAVYADLGLDYLRQGKYELAKTKLDRALELDSSLAAANHYMAEVMRGLDDLKQAENYYKKAVRLEPNDAMILNNYGAFLCKQKRFEDAEEYFLRAANTPRYRTPELAYENIALCAESIGDLEKAETNFRKALKINGSLPKSLFKMSVISYNNEDYFRARAFLERYHSRGKKTEATLKHAIAIEKALGNERAVEEYMDQLRAGYPHAEVE